MDNTRNAYMDAQQHKATGVDNTTPVCSNGVYDENMSSQGVEKPYTFRRLKSRDVFPMVTLIRKIGVSKEDISKLLDGDLTDEIKGTVNREQADNSEIGIRLILNIADVVLERLPQCENEIYDFLSRVSNLSVEEIKDLDLNVFMLMIVDFIKKDEFRDFFKAVSALMK